MLREVVVRLVRVSFRRSLVILLTVGAMAMAVRAEAQDGPDSRWRVRVDPMFMIAAGGDESGLVTTVPDVPENMTGLDTNEQSIDHGPGLALGVEYLVSRKLGVEVAAMAGAFDASYELTVDGVRDTWSGDIDFMAFTLGLNYHFTPDKRADYYLGLLVTSFEYDDLTMPLPALGIVGSWTFVGEDGWGYRGGVDIELKEGKPWFLAVGVRHFRGSFDVHPVMVSVGIGWRL